MKYVVTVQVTRQYQAIVEADSTREASALALDSAWGSYKVYWGDKLIKDRQSFEVTECKGLTEAAETDRSAWAHLHHDPEAHEMLRQNALSEEQGWN
jgi:hypothetical protein